MLTQCKNCKAKLRLPEDYDGEALRCPHCQFEVKANEDVEPLAECEHCWVEFKVKMSLIGERLKCTVCNRITKILPRSPRISAWCDACDSSISVPQKMVGWTIRCPKCEETTRVLEKESADFLTYKEEHEGDYFVVQDLHDLTDATRVKAQSVKQDSDDDQGKVSGGQQDPGHKMMPMMTRDLNFKAKPDSGRPRPKQPQAGEQVRPTEVSSSQSQIVDLTPDAYRTGEPPKNAPKISVRIKNRDSSPSSDSNSDHSRRNSGSNSDHQVLSDSNNLSPSSVGPGSQQSFDVDSDSDVDLSGIDLPKSVQSDDSVSLSFVEAQEVAASASQSNLKVRFKTDQATLSETRIKNSETQVIEPIVKPSPVADVPVAAEASDDQPSQPLGYEKKRDSPFENTVTRIVAITVALVLAAGFFYFLSRYIAESRRPADKTRIERKLEPRISNPPTEG